jgi:hypothetical protein
MTKTKKGPSMAYRVIQWSTGNVGKLALRGIINHPDLELVGLWVHSPDKVGRDAGDIVGLPPTGIKATNDVDMLLALEPDCVSYTATGDLRPSEAIDDMCRILASGANVVATSVVPLVFPPAADASIVARIQEACDQGGTTCFTSGIDPGFANDLLRAGGSKSPEDLGAMVGVDLADPGFWDRGLDIIERRLESTIEAAGAAGRLA